MQGFSNVVLMGNLTRDVEVKYMASGNALAKCGIAINRRRKIGGEHMEETTFVDLEAWGKTAELMHEHCAKGDPLLLRGRLKLDQWEDREGNRRSKLLVVVDEITFVPTRSQDETQPRRDQPPAKSESLAESEPASDEPPF
jgi:single-strand DNA-binding protein